MLRAVLFDLDDTLFDHEHAAREALVRVHRTHACFRGTAFTEFAAAHAAHLETLHRQVLAGELDIDAARVERFRRLLAAAGGDALAAAPAAAMYREGYVASRRPVSGAIDVLAALRVDVSIAVVSNNLLAEQREKLDQCGLAVHVDVLVVSEEAGVSKPDPQIFREALRRVGAKPEEAVMVGDSWAADVVGARRAGIVPIWFNPRGATAPAADPGVVELRAFLPAPRAVDTILSAHPARAHRN